MDNPDLHDTVKELNKLIRCSKCKNSNWNLLFCTSCKKTLCQSCSTYKYCAMCKIGQFESKTSIPNSYHFQHIIEFLPKLCVYSDKGCNLVSLLKRHEAYCEFRPIKCHVGEDGACTWTGTVKDWRAHVESSHPLLTVTSYIGSSKQLAIKSFKSSWTVRCFCLIVEDDTFLLYTTKMNGHLNQGVRKISLKKHNLSYHVAICFKTNNYVLYKCAMEAIEYNAENLQDIATESVGVPIEELNNIANDAGEVEMTFCIIRKELAKETRA